MSRGNADNTAPRSCPRPEGSLDQALWCRWLRCSAGIFMVMTLAPACDDRPEPAAPSAPGIQDGEKSPNARIFPEPLSDSADVLDGPFGMAGGPAAVRRPAQPMPRRASLTQEQPSRQVASGLGLEAQFVWSDARPKLTAAGRSHSGWPTWRIQLLPETDTDPARQRIEFTSSVSPLPQDTELRSRSDSEGWIVVWPDDRSYRVVPRGALRSVVVERRVDTVPELPVDVEPGDPPPRFGRASTGLILVNALGQLEIEFVAAPEVGRGGRLLCAVLMGLFRASSAQNLCGARTVPVRATYTWVSGERLLFEVTALEPLASLQVANFRVPPELSIFKPGELPPKGGSLWSEATFGELFPARGERELVFVNQTTVPLFVVIDQRPFAWLVPGQSIQRAFPGPVAYMARDFLGQVRFAGGQASPPATVRLGADPELEVPPAPPGTPAVP